jgi:hypothetical protein
MISTGAVPDYAEERFNLHCDDAEALLDALSPSASSEAIAEGLTRAEELQRRDEVFPNILESVARVVEAS